MAVPGNPMNQGKLQITARRPEFDGVVESGFPGSRITVFHLVLARHPGGLPAASTHWDDNLKATFHEESGKIRGP